MVSTPLAQQRMGRRAAVGRYFGPLTERVGTWRLTNEAMIASGQRVLFTVPAVYIRNPRLSKDTLLVVIVGAGEGGGVFLLQVSSLLFLLCREVCLCAPSFGSRAGAGAPAAGAM